MGKEAPAAPTPPDPVVTAQAQGDQNRETALAQFKLNNPDEFGPLGSRTFEDIGGGRFSATTALNPQAQQAFDAQQGLGLDLSNLAAGQVGRVGDTLGKPFDFSGAPQLPGVDDFGAERLRVEDALFDRFSGRINPRFDRQSEQLEARLANQGIGRGTEAFNEGFENLERDRTDALNLAQNDAILAGGQEQSRLFGLGSSARNQSLQESSFLRNIPINDVAALLGNSQLSIPQFGGVAGSTFGNVDIAGLQANQFAQQNAQNQAQQRAAAANNQAAFGLGSSFIGAAGSIIAASSKEYKNSRGGYTPVLERIGKLPVEQWQYKPEMIHKLRHESVIPMDEKVHIGPYAEDWAEIFGGNGKHINLIDGFGVCLAAIKELSAKVNHLEEEISHAN